MDPVPNLDSGFIAETLVHTGAGLLPIGTLLVDQYRS